jgi:tetratricopeptide (TPR) repeat protein
MADPRPHRCLPRWKKAAFAVMAAVLFFALVEGLLALAGVRPAIVDEDPLVGFSSTLPLFVAEGASSGASHLVTAPNKRELFNTQRFAHPKPAGTYRIFCLGGSTTYGHPYDDRTSFAGWLRELLPCVDPSRQWEVINAGGISYASYREAALVEELCRYQPDLFILFTGHNEFLEERTYGDLRELPAPVRGLSGVLAHTRTYAAVRKVLMPRPPARDRFLLPAEVDAVLDHTVGPKDYRRDEQLQRQVVAHFEFNLRRMAGLARAADAEMIYVTPVANLRDCSPFKSQHRAELSQHDRQAWSEAFQRGRKRQAAGDCAAALAAFDEALALDNLYAEAHYRRGQCLFELGRFDEARSALLRARDEDVCPLRAIAPLVESVRQAAAAQEAPLVDFERLLDAECRRRYGHAIPGRELFLDHVHPTIEVNGLLARTLVDALAQAGIVRAEATWRARCEAAVSERVTGKLEPRDHAVAHRMVAKVLSWAGKIEDAGPAALAALKIEPQDRESLFIAGAYLKFLGRDREGNEHYRRALQIEVAKNPQDVEARQFLAKTLLELGDLEAARQQVQEVLKLRPDSPEATQLLERIETTQPEVREGPG